MDGRERGEGSGQEGGRGSGGGGREGGGGIGDGDALTQGAGMQSETCGHWKNKGGEGKFAHRAHTLSDTPTYVCTTCIP